MQAYITGIVPISSAHWTKDTCLTIYFAGCDFRCPFCFSPDDIDFKEHFLVELKEIRCQIRINAPLVKGIYITGGEPCLQRQALLSIARFAKGLGLKVCIDTNGSKPETIRFLVRERLVDFISLDIKAPFDPELFERVTRSKTFFKQTNDIINCVRETLRVIRANSESIDAEVRTTIVPGAIFKKEDLLEIAELVDDLDVPWVLQPFNPSGGKVVDRRFCRIRPPTLQFIENIRRACYNKFPQLRIEIQRREKEQPEIVFSKSAREDEK